MTRAPAIDNPLESTRLRVMAAGLVFASALVLYAITLAPTVTLVDSGELIVAARRLGVAHPPGFPLYVLLAHLATIFPVGNVAVRVNFASSVFAALAAATLTQLVSEMLLCSDVAGKLKATLAGRNRARKRRGERSSVETAASSEEPRVHAVALVMPGVAAGLLFAFSRTLWGYATIAEVYTLNTFLILLIFALMFRWRRGVLKEGSTTGSANAPRKQDRWLNSAAFVFGLALGVHHVSVG